MNVTVLCSTCDALDRQTSSTVGYGDPAAQTTTTAYDLGGRATSVDDEFTCATTTYDYRDLALTETEGLTSGTPCPGTGRTVTNSYDGLGRLTQTEVTAGTDSGDRATAAIALTSGPHTAMTHWATWSR